MELEGREKGFCEAVESRRTGGGKFYLRVFEKETYRCPVEMGKMNSGF